MSVPDEIVKMLRTQADAVQVKSQALRPLVWLAGVLIPSGVAAIIFGPTLGQILGVLMVLAAMISVLWGYVYWVKKDPDRLGSEQLIMQKNVLQFMRETKDTRLALPDEPYRGVGELPEGDA